MGASQEQGHPGRGFSSVGLAWGPRICISNMIPGDVDAVSWAHTLSAVFLPLYCAFQSPGEFLKLWMPVSYLQRF